MIGLFRSPGRHRWATIWITMVLSGLGLAALAGVTVARTFTLKEAKNASVTSSKTHKTTHQNIVVISTGRAVYELSGDSKSHPECTKANSCFMFWPPVTVASQSSLSKGPGVPGTLGTWRRNGFLQVTLNGHPLYTYAFDSKPDVATGQDIVSFGGTWHVVPAAGSASRSSGGGW